jgi:hypothetical protein
MDLNWCIENTELAIERLTEKQSQHSQWVKDLDRLRKEKKELEEVYWKIREHSDKFDDFFKAAITTLKNLDTLEIEHNKGGVNDEGFLHRQSQLNTKLSENFEAIIGFHVKIENIIKEETELERDLNTTIKDLTITKKLESVECDKKINKINMDLKLERGKSEALQKKVSYTLYELDAINSELSDERTIDRISKLSRYLETWTTE